MGAVLLLIFAADDPLGYQAGYDHDRGGGYDQDDRIRQKRTAQQGEGIHEAHGGGNEHDGHDSNQEKRYVFDGFHLQLSAGQQGKHDDNAIDARGNGQWNEKAERLADE